MNVAYNTLVQFPSHSSHDRLGPSGARPVTSNPEDTAPNFRRPAVPSEDVSSTAPPFSPLFQRAISGLLKRLWLQLDSMPHHMSKAMQEHGPHSEGSLQSQRNVPILDPTVTDGSAEGHPHRTELSYCNKYLSQKNHHCLNDEFSTGKAFVQSDGKTRARLTV